MREFLMLAKVYDPKDSIIGWYLSEKMDGMRAYWDGGVSRGKDTQEIPWANNEKSQATSTGLWSRYGKVIHAPDSWLDLLPPIPLDGELWMGRGSFQETMSVCRRLEPDGRWGRVTYRVFDSPSYDAVFTTGTIRNPNFKKEIRLDACLDSIGRVAHQARPFVHVIELFNTMVWTENCRPCDQYKIDSLETMNDFLAVVLELRGEGIMVRHPGSYWCPNRSSLLLKLKPYLDTEGTVVGWTPGEGKYEGMLGALVIQWNGKQFQLSGFTDHERQLPCQFGTGELVTFRYRELSNDGIPKEARFLRKVVIV